MMWEIGNVRKKNDKKVIEIGNDGKREATNFECLKKINK